MNHFLETERFDILLTNMWEAAAEVGYLSQSQGGLTNFLLEYDFEN